MIKTLNALAEPNRLKIVDLLQSGPRSVGEIAEELGIRQPQVSKHLKVLVEAGLLEIERDAQRHIFHIRPQPFRELDNWLESFRRTWDERYDQLDELLRQWQANDHDQPE
ncbi:MAG: winged helix-turn-helix transcriptional regulator [Chloroflexi bacterium]|nr:winged helix-turn-helix transcriptional regulator [Chloroflexota bacterium]OJW05322.1 MAG: transcriptional regulator [Chloroflexi bacterium 54-19]